MAGALLATVLAGCAAPRPPAAPAAQPAPAGPPPLTASATVPPQFGVPSMRERMVYLARQEWSLFGSPVVQDQPDGSSKLSFALGTLPGHELQPPLLSRVLMYWYGVSRAPIVGYQGELRPWSAAFISWLAQGAGFTPQQFPRTVLHWDYIERFLQSGNGQGFVARDPLIYAPRVGDLVCNARNDGVRPDFSQQVNGFSALKRGPYHCDLVVGREADRLEAIGGNVGDAVSMTWLPLAADGRLREDARRRWVAVLEQLGR